MNIIDFIIIIIILVFTGIGYYRGFFKVVMNLVEYILGIFLAWKFHPSFAEFLNEKFLLNDFVHNIVLNGMKNVIENNTGEQAVEISIETLDIPMVRDISTMMVSIIAIEISDGGAMEIRNLLTFVTVAEMNSFTRAAQALDYAQSLLPIALEAAGQFYHKLRVDTLRLELTVGSHDPGDAALAYGRAAAAMGALWDPLVRAFHVEASLSLKLGQVLRLALYFGGRRCGRTCPFAADAL